MNFSAMPPYQAEFGDVVKERGAAVLVPDWRRVAAFTADILVVLALSAGVSLILGAGRAGPKSYDSWHLAVPLVMAVWADYTIFSIAGKGSTFGGRLFKVWVCNEDGSLMSLARSARRWAWPWLVVGLAVILMVYAGGVVAWMSLLVVAVYGLVNYLLVPHYDAQGRTLADVLAHTRPSGVDPRNAMAPKARRVHRVVWLSGLVLLTVIGVGVGVVHSVEKASGSSGPASATATAQLIGSATQREAHGKVVTLANVSEALQAEMVKSIGVKSIGVKSIGVKSIGVKAIGVGVTGIALGRYTIGTKSSEFSLIISDTAQSQYCVRVTFSLANDNRPVLGGRCYS